MPMPPALDTPFRTPSGLLDPQAFVPIATAAELCDCSPDTFRKRRKKGKLRLTTLPDDGSSRLYIRIEDLAGIGRLTAADLEPVRLPHEPAGALGTSELSQELVQLRAERERLTLELELKDELLAARNELIHVLKAAQRRVAA